MICESGPSPDNYLSSFAGGMCRLFLAVFVLSGLPAQSAVTFNITYPDYVVSDPTYAPIVTSLEDVFTTVGGWFNHTATLEIYAQPTELASGVLATGTAYYSTAVGFNDARAAEHILTGIAPNSAAYDGLLNISPYFAWDFDDEVGASSYDFKSMIMHEALHMLGFMSLIELSSTPGTTGFFSTFDSFVTNGSSFLINSDATYAAIDLVSGGIYFEGTNAVNAYGGPVPLYSPDLLTRPSHLDETIFGDLLMTPMMDMGPGARYLSALEVGILQDMGFSINASALAPVPEPAHAAIAVGLCSLLWVWHQRRKRRAGHTGGTA